MSLMAGHPTMRLTVGRNSADIDLGLWRIIAGLWYLGCYTTKSCELQTPSGSPTDPNWPAPRPYIEFQTASCAELFLWWLPHGMAPNERWTVDAFFFNESFLERAHLSTTILFPQECLKPIERALVERIKEGKNIDLDALYEASFAARRT